MYNRTEWIELFETAFSTFHNEYMNTLQKVARADERVQELEEEEKSYEDKGETIYGEWIELYDEAVSDYTCADFHAMDTATACELLRSLIAHLRDMD